MIYLDVAKKIEKLREKLHRSIDKNGLNANETQRISSEVDKLVNRYYEKEREYQKNEGALSKEYIEAYEELKKLTKQFGEFPSVPAWNHYAKQKVLISSESIKYISGLNWNELRSKVFLEINK